MIVVNYDPINRLLIQTPGNQSPAVLNPFVYGDNFNFAIYLTPGGTIQQTINPADTITAFIYNRAATALPLTNLGIIGTATIQSDGTNDYFELNINLATTQLAALVQTNLTTLACNLHIQYSPADGERISDGEDTLISINSDPTQGSSGGTPAPSGYPSSPSVFQLIAGKDVASGYVGLNSSKLMDPTEIPIAGGLSVVSGNLVSSPYTTTFSTFSIPAKGSTVNVTVNTNSDILVNTLMALTDGTNLMFGVVTTVSGTTITFKNVGVGGAITGTMGAGRAYMGATPALASTSFDGLMAMLPSSGGTGLWMRGDNSWQALPLPALTTSSSFTIPSNAGTVNVTVASASDFIVNQVHVITDGTSFMVGTVTTITGLIITYTNTGLGAVTGSMSAGRVYMGSPSSSGGGGGGGTAYLTTVNSFSIPGAQSTVGITLAASVTDLLPGAIVYITDGSHFIYATLNGISGTSATIKNIGVLGNVSGTMASGARLYLAGDADVHTTSNTNAGMVIADGTVITRSSTGLITVPDATSSTLGVVKVDGTTISAASGVISVVNPAPGQHGARYYNNANITYGTSGSPQVLTFNTVIYDTDSYYSAGKFTVPTGQAGYYLVGCTVAWASAFTAATMVAVQYNGGTNAYPIIDQRATSSSPGFNSLGPTITISGVIHLAVGDYIQITVGASSTGTITFGSGVLCPSAFLMRIS